MPSKKLIISVAEPLARFIQDTAFFRGASDVGIDQLEESLDIIVDRVLQCISHANCAVSSLWDYANELRGCDGYVINSMQYDVIARAVVRMGESILYHLQELRAYDRQHLLHYDFTGRIGRDSLILDHTLPRSNVWDYASPVLI